LKVKEQAEEFYEIGKFTNSNKDVKKIE